MSVRGVCSCGRSKLAGNPQYLLNLSFFSSLTHSKVLFLWGLVKSFHTVLERCVTSLAADRHRKLPGEMKEMNPWEQEGRKGWGRDSRVAVFLLFFFLISTASQRSSLVRRWCVKKAWRLWNVVEGAPDLASEFWLCYVLPVTLPLRTFLSFLTYRSKMRQQHWTFRVVTTRDY